MGAVIRASHHRKQREEESRDYRPDEKTVKPDHIEGTEGSDEADERMKLRTTLKNVRPNNVIRGPDDRDGEQKPKAGRRVA